MNRVEQYMLVISRLLNTKGKARLTDISNVMNTSNSQISDMINELLVPNGLVKKDHKKSMIITYKGQKLINRVQNERI